MGRPTKPLALVQGHRTKKEKAIREKAEKELLTGISLREAEEVKKDPIAHKEFLRIKKLLKEIGQDDDLYGSIINEHCKTKSECIGFENDIQRNKLKAQELKKRYDLGEFDFLSYVAQDNSITDIILDIDKKVMAKRKLMLDISKENIMTIQSALRSIPKKPEAKKESPMDAFLKKRQAVNNGT